MRGFFFGTVWAVLVMGLVLLRRLFEMILRPCPFCGGSASFERLGTARQSCVITCDQCGCSHESGDVGERSGTSWNCRVGEPEVPVILPVPE